MQKVIDLLEKHVQWLALGLGVVWLLLMTWTYVINPPAEVTIGSETLTAGEVDEYSVASAVRPLEEAMKPKEAPPMQVDNFAERWLKRMDWQEAEPIQTEGLIASARPIDPKMFGPDSRRQLPPGGTEIAVDPNKPVAPGADATIPVLPAALVADWRFGRSTIIEPPPIVPIGQPQPPAPLVPPEIDKDWITQSFKVNLPSIAAAFQKAQVPPPVPGTGNTAFLRVEMARQELMPNGNWGNDTVLKPLPPLQPNMVRQPFPAPKAGIHQENAYLNWAVQNTGDIVQPAFYQTVLNKGDIWQRPGEPAPGLNAAAFNPAAHVGGRGNLNQEQWDAVLKYRREQSKLKAEQKRQQQPRAPRGRPGDEPPEMMEGMMNYAPLDAERPKFLQVRPPYRPPYNPNLPPDMQGMEDGMMMEDPAMMEQAMAPQILGVGTPDLDYPAGQFDPATWAAPVPGAPVPPPGTPVRPQDVSIWAHDDTVQPGKTYRYRVRYTLLNPLFNKPGVAKNPADARQFAIESPFSDWGPAIEVPSLTNFFIANALMNQGKVRFDVYHWEKGQQHHTIVTAGPGDMIAANQNGVNFATGHTIVELRPALRGGDPVVFLANGTGQAVVRTQRGDLNHPVYKKLKEIVAAAQAQAQAAAGGAIPAR